MQIIITENIGPELSTTSVDSRNPGIKRIYRSILFFPTSQCRQKDEILHLYSQTSDSSHASDVRPTLVNTLGPCCDGDERRTKHGWPRCDGAVRLRPSGRPPAAAARRRRIRHTTGAVDCSGIPGMYSCDFSLRILGTHLG
jgi:hypothetical protein